MGSTLKMFCLRKINDNSNTSMGMVFNEVRGVFCWWRGDSSDCSSRLFWPYDYMEF